MKKQLLLAILLASTISGFSQATKDSAKRVSVINRQVSGNLKVIPATKAITVRKNIVVLKTHLKTMSDSVTVTKKEIDDVVNSLKNDLDNMSEMGEAESLRLQMAMDRLSKMMSTLSNILKKISDTQQSITQNLK